MEDVEGFLGYRLYQKEGLKMPESVQKATKEYRDQSDRLSMFTNQCLQKQAGAELRSSAVYSRYKDWCAENGFKYENAVSFKKKMSAAGFVYMLRRPWNENSEKTVMVNDVTWATVGVRKGVVVHGKFKARKCGKP